MTKEISLKTDASFKHGVGCGISYNAKVEWGERMIHYKNSKFTHSVQDSTHGELVAAVYGIIKTFEQIETPSEYKMNLGTDCEFVVDSLTKRYPDQPKLVKIALNILEMFDGWNVRWIPRVKNNEADVLARSQLMKHEDGCDCC